MYVLDMMCALDVVSEWEDVGCFPVVSDERRCTYVLDMMCALDVVSEWEDVGCFPVVSDKGRCRALDVERDVLGVVHALDIESVC